MAGLVKKYLYKISRGGQFLGVLQNVESPFTLTQNINTAGAQLVVSVGLDPDTSRDSVDTLITEDGDDLITEDGDTLVTERSPDMIGNSNSQSLIRNNNDVLVYEFSDYFPNGRLVFSGYISKWAAEFGGSGVTVTMINYGAELDNYLVEGSTTLDASQQSGTDTEPVYDNFGGHGGGWNHLGQSWLVGTGVTNLYSILIKAAVGSAVSQTVTITVYDNALFSGTPLGSTSRDISSATAAEYQFIFSTPLVVVPGATYYFSITSDTSASQSLSVYYKASTNPYANGTMYNSFYNGGSGGGSWFPVPIASLPAGSDLYFQTYYTASATVSPFNSQDPATAIGTILTSYNGFGGLVTAGTLTATGTTVSYTFKLNTVLEAVKKMVELSPADFYWYVDPATNQLNFKETSATADHTFIKGRHLSTVNIEASVEDVKNIVYFSGGDTGSGSNLFTTSRDEASLALYRRGLERISDNRVTTSATAAAIMSNFLSINSEEIYHTTVEIVDTTYDIGLINIGQTVGFSGFGTFIDSILLQVVSKTARPDGAALTLGVLPRRATKTIEDLLRAVNDLQTIDNPNAPS